MDDPESVSADSVIVVCGDKSRYISSDDFISYIYSSGYSYSADSLQVEQLLTEAINYVTSDETPVVYTLSGHSEKDLSSDVISSFEGDNYAVETLSLLSAGAVPDDCDILLINGPQTDITEDEKAQIETYMANGGKSMYSWMPAWMIFHSCILAGRVRCRRGTRRCGGDRQHHVHPVSDLSASGNREF